MVGPLGGGARDPGAPTINEKNIDSGPLGRCCRRSGSVYHQRKKHRWWSPYEAMPEDLGVPTINTKNVDDGPPDPRGGPVSTRDLKGVL
jgi:hypothetical protein